MPNASPVEDFVHRIFVLAVVLSFFSCAANAQKPPLLPEKDVAALAQELSGETAKRNLEGLTRFHRQRGSQGFHSAAELVAEHAVPTVSAKSPSCNFRPTAKSTTAPSARVHPGMPSSRNCGR